MRVRGVRRRWYCPIPSNDPEFRMNKWREESNPSYWEPRRLFSRMERRLVRSSRKFRHMVWEPDGSRRVPSDFSDHWAAPDTCHVRDNALDRLLVVPVVDVRADLNSGGQLRCDVPVFGGMNLLPRCSDSFVGFPFWVLVVDDPPDSLLLQWWRGNSSRTDSHSTRLDPGNAILDFCRSFWWTPDYQGLELYDYSSRAKWMLGFLPSNRFCVGGVHSCSIR